MDDWKKLKESLLSEKDKFYSHLNMEDITDEYYYVRTRRACKDLN